MYIHICWGGGGGRVDLLGVRAIAQTPLDIVCFLFFLFFFSRRPIQRQKHSCKGHRIV